MVSDKEGTNYGIKFKSHSTYAYSYIQYNVTGRDDEINLSGLENYKIGHSSDVENIWFVVK